MTAPAFKDRRPSHLRVDLEEEIDANGVRIANGRSRSSERPSEAEIDVCRRWIRLHVIPTRTIRDRAFSYGLKHRVESWTRTRAYPDAASGEGESREHAGVYVSNGSFIVAAMREGYVAQRVRFNSPNVFFNMTRVRPPKSPKVVPVYERSAATTRRPTLRLILGGRPTPRGAA